MTDSGLAKNAGKGVDLPAVDRYGRNRRDKVE